VFSTESDGFDREGDEGGRRTSCSNPERDAFNEDGGGETLSVPTEQMVGDPASMELTIKMRTPRKSYTVASNAEPRKRRKF
jgi:hypothetical protein